MDDLEAEQRDRERAQREAALGQRLRSIDRGDLGPALQRWVSGSIVPVAGRLRSVAECALGDDRGGGHGGGGRSFADLLASPLFGLPEAVSVGGLQPLFEWCLKGKSEGFGKGATYAEDLVLAALGTAVVRCAGSGEPVPLVRILSSMADAMRETVVGQFLTTVQGAKALQSVRKGKDHAWQERKQLDAVAALMAGQVRSALGSDTASCAVNGREVVTVFNEKMVSRQITLRRPEKGDWAVLDLARHPKGEADRAKSTWLSMGMVILCAAQAEAGWFDLVEIKPQRVSTSTLKRRAHRPAKGLVLSEDATRAIQGDLKRWLQLGFIREPMLTPPVDGDYLTVKHRKVLGARGPGGVKTDGEGTAAWYYACKAMAETPWEVAAGTLQWVNRRTTHGDVPQGEQGETLSGGPPVAEARGGSPDDGHGAFIRGCYARSSAAGDRLHFPIRMDFRGRIYLQTPFVTYQGSDLQKGLLCFPEVAAAGDETPDGRSALSWEHPRRAPLRSSGGEAERASEGTRMPGYVRDIILPLHLGALYGGPDKLDKAPLPARREWLQRRPVRELVDVFGLADEPVQLQTALSLLEEGRWDDIPCQIDGTCNGLQHLSALFRDGDAAPFVNLVASRYDQPPADIYGTVGERVLGRLEQLRDPWARRLAACIQVDRKLCKKPVMVLPYGGQRATIEDACLTAILEQHNGRGADYLTGAGLSPWSECLAPGDELGSWVRDEDALKGNYLAFRDRDIANHPLLHLDAKRLGGLVWDAIEEILPKPIQAMASFRAIAKAVGSRTLEWSTGFVGDASLGLEPLWVVQAKAVSQKSTLRFKGLHLPGSIRGLALRQGKDEVDPAAHTTGIVANFIHSMDADHQTRTMALFLAGGGKDFGAIFDCYITRPSQMPLLMRCTRRAFADKYADAQHPLMQPVRMRHVNPVGERESLEEFANWFELAGHLGVWLPEFGTWKPEEVMDSAWFFS